MSLLDQSQALAQLAAIFALGLHSLASDAPDALEILYGCSSITTQGPIHRAQYKKKHQDLDLI